MAGVEIGVRLDNFVVFMASVAIGIHRVALAACAYAGWPLGDDGFYRAIFTLLA